MVAGKLPGFEKKPVKDKPVHEGSKKGPPVKKPLTAPLDRGGMKAPKGMKGVY